MNKANNSYENNPCSSDSSKVTRAFPIFSLENFKSDYLLKNIIENQKLCQEFNQKIEQTYGNNNEINEISTLLKDNHKLFKYIIIEMYNYDENVCIWLEHLFLEFKSHVFNLFKKLNVKIRDENDRFQRQSEKLAIWEENSHFFTIFKKQIYLIHQGLVECIDSKLASSSNSHNNVINYNDNSNNITTHVCHDLLKPKEILPARKKKLKCVSYIKDENDNSGNPFKNGLIKLSYHTCKKAKFDSYNLKYNEIFNLKEINYAPITAMVSHGNYVFTGHMDGCILLWNFPKITCIINGKNCPNSAIKCIYVDKSSFVWVGSTKGTICVYFIMSASDVKLVKYVKIPDSASNHLHTNKYLNANKYFKNYLKKSNDNVDMNKVAHHGPVSCIYGKDNHIFSSGGRCSSSSSSSRNGYSKNKQTIISWYKDDNSNEIEYKKYASIDKYGYCNCMEFVENNEITGSVHCRTWSLLTAHNSGNILSWDITSLECKLIIDIENGPITSLIISKELGLWITGHQNGTIKYIKQSKNMTSNQIMNIVDGFKNENAKIEGPLVLVPRDTGELKTQNTPILKLLHEKGHILSCSSNGKIMSFERDLIINEARKCGIELTTNNDTDQIQDLTDDNTEDEKTMHLTSIEKKALKYVYEIYQTKDKNDIANFIELYSKQNIDMSMKCGHGSEGYIRRGKGRHKGRAYKFIPHLIDFKDLEIKSENSLFEEKDSRRQTVVNNRKITLNDLFDQVKIMVHTNHTHIVNFYGICLDPVVIIMEFCEKGSLHSYLREFKKFKSNGLTKKYSFRVILKLLKQIVDVMIYLHSEKNIIHGDLKSPNILLDKNLDIKITDFGFARILNQSKSQVLESSHFDVMSHDIANPQWLAPEVIVDKEYSKKADVYSFSIIMWEFLALEDPWRRFCNSRDSTEFFNRISILVKEGERLHIPVNIENESNVIYTKYIELMQQCWNELPDCRPSFESIFNEIEEMEQYLEPEIISKNDCLIKNYIHYKNELNFDIKLNHILKNEESPSNDESFGNRPIEDPEPQKTPFTVHQSNMTKESGQHHSKAFLQYNNSNNVIVEQNNNGNKNSNIIENRESIKSLNTSMDTRCQSMEIRVINEANISSGELNEPVINWCGIFSCFKLH